MSPAKAHVHLNIGNADASLRFYQRLFGAEPIRQQSNGATFDLSEPPLFLVIREEPRTGVNAGHFGIVVSSSEELERTALALQARGLAPERREAKLWLEDPDGNGWEVIVAR